MAHGNIQCSGSSLFLKSLYGVGYTMTLSKGLAFKEEEVSEGTRRKDGGNR